MTFWNDGTFTRTSSVQGLPDILKWHNLQSLNKILDLLIEFKFCESDFYFLNKSKNCMVATYIFGSVYIKSWVHSYIFGYYANEIKNTGIKDICYNNQIC